MEAHQGLHLAEYMAESENDLDGLCSYARKKILELGILDTEDPRYNEIADLCEGILVEIGDRQAYFKTIYHIISHSPVFKTEQSKLNRDHVSILGED
jgi:hypothetical protein